MKKIFGILMVMIVGLGMFTGVPTYAVGDEGANSSGNSSNSSNSASSANSNNSNNSGQSCSSSFLGFYPWYEGLTDADCNIVTPSDTGDGKGLANFVWTIILNVMADLTLAIGYIMLGVTIWGGFYMITSAGNPDKVTKARKILTAGVAGSIIGVLASVIAHVIISIL